ncbi:hypothetical protein GG344DRAFT_71417, partial [Lentinula edodes]
GLKGPGFSAEDPTFLERKKAAAREKAVCEVQEQAIQAWQQEEEVIERRRLLAEVAAARSQWGTSPSEVEIPQREKGEDKGKGKAKAQPVGGDPDDGNDGNDDNDWAPCEWCKSKKLPCQMQAGKRSSVICLMGSPFLFPTIPLSAVEETGRGPHPAHSYRDKAGPDGCGLGGSGSLEDSVREAEGFEEEDNHRRK